MASTSHSLLDQIREGPSPLAWKRWHALYEPLIHTWLRRHRLIPADQEDLVQDVLAVVVRRIPEFQHNGRVGAFRTWLKTITINCLRDHWKERQRHPDRAAALDVLDDWADEKGTLSQAWDREHDRHLLQKLLDFLEPEFTRDTWVAFQQFVVEGKTATEVSEALGLSVNAIYIAKSRVLARLRAEAVGLVDDPAW